MGTGLEALRADRALVGPGVAVLRHVPRVLALAIERGVADLARVSLLLQRLLLVAALTLRRLLFPEIQRRVVQVLGLIAVLLLVVGLTIGRLRRRVVLLLLRFAGP